MGAVVAYAVNQLLDEKTTLGMNAIEKLVQGAFELSAFTQKLQLITGISDLERWSKDSSQNAKVIQAWLDTPTSKLYPMLYKDEQLFHGLIISLQPDQWWSQITGILSGETTEKSKKIHREARALAMTMQAIFLVELGKTKEEALNMVKSKINPNDSWDI